MKRGKATVNKASDRMQWCEMLILQQNRHPLHAEREHLHDIFEIYQKLGTKKLNIFLMKMELHNSYNAFNTA